MAPCAFEVSFEAWPLVTFVVGAGMTDADYEALLRAWETVLERDQRFVALTDTRGMRGIPNAAQRAVIAAWRRKVGKLVAGLTLGQATVIDNALARGAMTALGWLQKYAAPSAYFGTPLEACDWCIERLREGGLAVTPELEAYRTRLAREGS